MAYDVRQEGLTEYTADEEALLDAGDEGFHVTSGAVFGTLIAWRQPWDVDDVGYDASDLVAGLISVVEAMEGPFGRLVEARMADWLDAELEVRPEFAFLPDHLQVRTFAQAVVDGEVDLVPDAPEFAALWALRQ